MRYRADEIIETGEIVEKRSLVIRRAPIAEWTEEPTEVVAKPIAPPVVKRKWHFACLAAGVALGIAGMFFVRSHPSADTIAAIETRAEMLGTMLDGDARAAALRADAIAKSPVLRAAIATDAQTIADMARDNDITFPLERGDTIEVFQVNGGKRSLLLRLPKGARPIGTPPADGEAQIAAAQNHVVAIANARVTTDSPDTSGELVLSRPVDLEPFVKRLSEHATGATLTGLGDAVVLIGSGSAPNITMPVPTKTRGTLSLATVAVEATHGGIAWSCMIGSALLLALFGVITVRMRRAKA